MIITILTVGKRHEPWIEPGVRRFFERLRAPFAAKMHLIPHSSLSGDSARQEESRRILSRIHLEDFVILLDERGKNLSSPELAQLISDNYMRQIVIIVGGAYGVDETVRNRANLIWSLSRLVFPHQLVRLIIAEQLYRAQEISRGSKYHHD